MNDFNFDSIFPLTIVQMRYGGKFVIFNSYSTFKIINDVEEDEEISYDIENWLEKTCPSYGVKFGIGSDIWQAYYDYTKRNEQK